MRKERDGKKGKRVERTEGRKIPTGTEASSESRQRRSVFCPFGAHSSNPTSFYRFALTLLHHRTVERSKGIQVYQSLLLFLKLFFFLVVSLLCHSFPNNTPLESPAFIHFVKENPSRKGIPSRQLCQRT